MGDGKWFAWYPVRADRRSRRDKGRWVWLRWVWMIPCRVGWLGSVQLDGFHADAGLFHPRTATIYTTYIEHYEQAV